MASVKMTKNGFNHFNVELVNMQGNMSEYICMQFGGFFDKYEKICCLPLYLYEKVRQYLLNKKIDIKKDLSDSDLSPTVTIFETSETVYVKFPFNVKASDIMESVNGKYNFEESRWEIRKKDKSEVIQKLNNEQFHIAYIKYSTNSLYAGSTEDIMINIKKHMLAYNKDKFLSLIGEPLCYDFI